MSQVDLTPATVAAVFGTWVLTTNLTRSRVRAAPWQKASVMVLLRSEGIAAVAYCTLATRVFNRKAAT